MNRTLTLFIFTAGVAAGILGTKMYYEDKIEAREYHDAMARIDEEDHKRKERDCPVCVANTKRNFDRIVSDL
jgi:hypothetical protein